MERAKVNGREIVFLERREGDVLGYAVWYTFSRLVQNKDVVKGWFRKYGLSEFTPDDPNHRDAFKRICSEYKEKRLRSEDGVEVYLLIRPVERGGNLRKLVLEKRSGGRKLSYDVVGELEFVRDEKTGYERIERFLETTDPDVRRIVAEIVDRWEREKDCYTEEHLRRILLDIIDECGRVKLKPSGSVYFVPIEHFHYVERFSRIVDEIRAGNPENRTEIWFAPIVNTDQFREMVKRKVEDTIQETLDSAIKRLVELSEAEDVDERERARRIGELAARIESAAQIAERYARMLRMSLNRAENLLTEAREILSKIQRAQTGKFKKRAAIA